MGSFQSESNIQPKEVDLDPVEMKKTRSEYFFNLLRDPAENEIPQNIRTRELAHAKGLPNRSDGFLRKGQAGQAALDISWQLAGPSELGGRTRALAIDQRYSEIILAGGVSGGVWKSTDGGNTWQMRTDPDQNMSVSSIAQDPTNPDTWYYASGEINGSAGASGAPYYGRGIYKSTDNGNSWSLLTQASSDSYQYVDEFNTVSRIRVSPTTGTVFISSNGNGIYRSTDGQSFSSTPLTTENEPLYCDVTVAPDGTVAAVISDASFSDSQSLSSGANHNAGVFVSNDDGQSWTEVTPGSFPGTHRRSVLAFAPSNPDILYVFTLKGANDTSNQGVSFHKLDLNAGTSNDRSANLPDFGDPVGGVNLQGGYNMVVSVKPDDPDFVMVGGTNLFRSRDGFATAPADANSDGFSDSDGKDEYWIGGYAKANNVSQYPGQHPDQHVIIYDPNNPNRVWSGHDGGLSLTSDITTAAISWQNQDGGYVTGQFYTVAIPSGNDDDRLLGGTQDNGTPFFRYDNSNQQQTSLLDVSSGDGAYAFWRTNYAYVSSQLGNVVRLGIKSDGSITSPYEGSTSTDYSFVYPSSASNQLFIHPYAIDPNDEGIMYYPGGNMMWRNTAVDELPSGSQTQGGTSQGWDNFSAVSNANITSLEVTDAQPSDRLYYAGSGSGAPQIFYVDNASTTWSPQDISISGVPPGAYVHDIAINPRDGNEVIAVMSNYNIVGLYHSTNGGSSWAAIEGNLEGDMSNPGPSIRNATILPTSSGTIYLVGTSTGVYSTTSLDGSSTSWTRESADNIGYSVSEHIVSRPSDGKIAVGTHGRGIFVGQANVESSQGPMVDVTKSVNADWQLIGSPMKEDSDVQIGADMQVFGFTGKYQDASVIESQKGYWVKSSSGSQLAYNGEGDTTATIPLDEGWNMIGGLVDTVSESAISDPNGILGSSPTIYEYNSGAYQDASEIKSTQGYWIHANQAGNIEISASSSSSSKSTLADLPSGLQKMKFQSGTASQLFYVSPHSLDEKVRNRFLMPPQAPRPALDVRTPEGFRLADGENTELELTTGSYPVSVSILGNNSSSFLLKGITGKDTVYYDLSGGGKVQIQRPHQKLMVGQASPGEQITEHTLLPNYPNPFNPSTRIRYQVASQANVQLQVYDVLGRRVRTLVDGQQQPGSYTVRFDGRNLSSGTYFIHLKAGDITGIQKMTLIK